MAMPAGWRTANAWARGGRSLALEIEDQAQERIWAHRHQGGAALGRIELIAE